jgi:hypothetical protein
MQCHTQLFHVDFYFLFLCHMSTSGEGASVMIDLNKNIDMPKLKSLISGVGFGK